MTDDPLHSKTPDSNAYWRTLSTPAFVFLSEFIIPYIKTPHVDYVKRWERVMSC